MSIDKEVATSALKAFKRHTWYLHAEFVPLALWDDITPERKQKLADKILQQKKQADNIKKEEFVGRMGSGYGKPDLQAINTEAKHLHELVTPASWRFFDILGISEDFLHLPNQDWLQNDVYKEAARSFKHMKVTNDSAERSVKLCADFLGLAKNEEIFQNYLQVVEEERRRTPNVRKAMKRSKE